MTKSTTPVLVQNLGKPGQTVKTPEVIRFTGASITVWTERQADKHIRETYHLTANGLLLRRFELDLMLADKAAWVVLADASAHGVFYPCEDHTVTLLRFEWNGTVKIVTVLSGHELPSRSRADVPQEVWRIVDQDWQWYCWPHGR